MFRRHTPKMIGVAGLLTASVAFAGLSAVSRATSTNPGNRQSDLEGVVSVYYERWDEASRLVYVMDSDGGQLSLHFAPDSAPGLRSGSRINVKGVRKGQDFYVGSAPADVQILADSAYAPEGQRTAVLLINFEDKTDRPYAVENARDSVFGPNAVSLKKSESPASLRGDVFGWYTIPFDSRLCGERTMSTIGGLARSAATAAGVDLSRYGSLVYVVPEANCDWESAATVGGDPSEAWIRVHELTAAAVERAMELPDTKTEAYAVAPESSQALRLPNDAPSPESVVAISPTVQFPSSASGGTESQTAASLPVVLSAPSTQTVTVNYTFGGTAQTGTDFVATSGTLTFAPGETTKTIGASIVNDTVAEPTKTMLVTLSTPTNATLGPLVTNTYYIFDNDNAAVSMPTAQFVSVGSSGLESTSPANLWIVLSAPSTQSVSVGYKVTGGTAGPADYTMPLGPLVFAPGETAKAISVGISDDNLYQPQNKDIGVILQVVTNAMVGQPAGYTYTILDNDIPPVIQFTQASSSGSETATPAAIRVSTSSTLIGYGITVDYAVTGGTATSGSDYTLASGKLSFFPRDTSKTINMPIIDDSLAEGNESVVLTLSNPTSGGSTVPVTVGPIGTYTYTIVDNETSLLPTVQFSATSGSGSESATTASLPVVLSGASTQTVTVHYAVTGGTATGGGVDYTLSSGTLTFNPGETSKSLSLAVVNDTIVESNETIAVTLSAPTNVTLGVNNTSTYTITDNDTSYPTVQFSGAASSGSESATAASLPVILSAASSQTVTVNYAVTGGTATGGGVDYTLANGTLTFSPGETSKSISLAIVNDTLVEPSETVAITLSAPANATLGATMTSTYTITDNDANPTVQFNAAASSGSESVTTAGLSIFLSAASSQTVRVNYAVTGGTATGGGVDYALANGTMTFNPGETAKAIGVTIVNDTLVESNETIVVTLSAPANATLGVTTTTTYTINDNDVAQPPTVNFMFTTSSGSEGVTPASLPVVLSAAASSTVTVNYAVTSGTATGGGVDYNLPSGTLTFNPGETSKSISVAIVNDTLVESNENFVVSLSAPVGATLGTNKTDTFMIADNDAAPLPSVQFGAGSLSGSENVTAVSLPVTLSAAATSTVTVGYAVTGGTATGGGVDYTLASGTVTFNAGETSKSVSLAIVNDSFVDANETIVVTLSGPTGATLGGTTSCTFTILDDDNTADVTGPTMAFVSPMNGATVTGKITLNVSASDPSGVTRVEFYVNGALKNTDSSAPYVYALSSRGLRGQNVTFTAKGYDARGNTTTVSIVVNVQ